MRIGRAIIIPVIVALTAAGSVLAGSAATAAAAQPSSTHVVSATHAAPRTYYHW